MREIKFRAWGSQGQGMFPVDEIDLLNKEVNYGLTGYVLMQYTGLLDKNGKEIYEGDVVDEGDRNYVVEIPEVYYTNYGDGLYAHRSVVIGNIYENADLLE